jgi:hypothetical protein
MAGYIFIIGGTSEQFLYTPFNLLKPTWYAVLSYLGLFVWAIFWLYWTTREEKTKVTVQE